MNAPTPDLAKATKPKGKGGGIVRILLFGLAFVAGAGAGGFGAILAASQLGLGTGAASHAEAPPALEHGPVAYIEIDNAFTSNLVDTGRYLQLRISVSTTGGEAVTKAIELHKPALASTCSRCSANSAKPMSPTAPPRTGCASPSRTRSTRRSRPMAKRKACAAHHLMVVTPLLTKQLWLNAPRAGVHRAARVPADVEGASVAVRGAGDRRGVTRPCVVPRTLHELSSRRPV